jgi:hypothetical protein
MGKSTISMAIFNSYVKLPKGNFNGEINNALEQIQVGTEILTVIP